MVNEDVKESERLAKYAKLIHDNFPDNWGEEAMDASGVEVSRKTAIHRMEIHIQIAKEYSDRFYEANSGIGKT